MMILLAFVTQVHATTSVWQNKLASWVLRDWQVHLAHFEERVLKFGEGQPTSKPHSLRIYAATARRLKRKMKFPGKARRTFGDERNQPSKASKEQDVVQAYLAFFDHIALRKGWRKVPFSAADVSPLFEVAAQVVVQVRQKLDQQTPGMKLRQVSGNANELLWNTSAADLSEDVAKQFVRKLVVATLSDANGLVEGLTTDKVEKCLQPVLSQHPFMTKHTANKRKNKNWDNPLKLKSKTSKNHRIS
eukprot:gnl/MRDRNA2_/MRDRNA2_80802_c0_seq2.p1 gnl/MRDRNA2_/MRDRNA2_80802_c0~~gnl/MRDRNA2_/MRDRNA2_80802_c0_seq2.p1  ORF type:complete len:246 (-),score=44.69 gnl/MRDRNA2_/MRDRNA2_80802_c0_seq2:404-1141(-)